MAEPDPEAEIEVNVKAVCDGETRELKTLAELRRFANEYAEFYSFTQNHGLPPNQQPFSHIPSLLKSVEKLPQTVDGVATAAANNLQNILQQITNTLNADNKANLPHHTSTRAQAIKRIWQEHGAKAGVGATLLAIQHAQMGGVWSNPEAIKGALAYTLADPSLENTATKNAEAGLKDALRNLQIARDSLLAETDDFRRDLQGQIKQQDNALDEIRASFAAAIKALADEYDGRASAAVTKIEDTEKIFRDFMELEAPREYWATKATRHETKGWIFASVAMTWLVGIGGFGAFKLWSFLTPLVNEIDPNASLAAYAPSAALGLIASTIFFWVSRIFVRLWLSEVHLGMDAQERVVMVQSYLALKNDSHVSDEDRALILTPLFRPTQDGIVKDDAAADPSLMGILSNVRKN